MRRHSVQRAVVAGMLVLGMVPVTWANSALIPVTTGVVATITHIDAHHGMATLQTEAGEVFQLPKDTRWKVGDKVECDRVNDAAYPRLRDCKPW